MQPRTLTNQSSSIEILNMQRDYLRMTQKHHESTYFYSPKSQIMSEFYVYKFGLWNISYQEVIDRTC